MSKEKGSAPGPAGKRSGRTARARQPQTHSPLSAPSEALGQLEMPGTPTAALLQLQRVSGNRAVTRLVQRQNGGDGGVEVAQAKSEIAPIKITLGGDKSRVSGEVGLFLEKDKALPAGGKTSGTYEVAGQEVGAEAQLGAVESKGSLGPGNTASVFSAAVLKATVAKVELYKGIELSVNTTALELEIGRSLDEGQSIDPSLLKVDVALAGTLDKKNAGKGQWGAYVQSLIEKGYSVKVQGKAEVQVKPQDAAKLVRQARLLRARAENAKKLSKAQRELERIQGELKKLKKQRRHLKRALGGPNNARVQQAFDEVNKQRKKLVSQRNKLRKRIIPGLKDAVKKNNKAIQEVTGELSGPVARRISKAMGKKAAQQLLKAIPFVNIIFIALDVYEIGSALWAVYEGRAEIGLGNGGDPSEGVKGGSRDGTSAEGGGTEPGGEPGAEQSADGSGTRTADAGAETEADAGGQGDAEREGAADGGEQAGKSGAETETSDTADGLPLDVPDVEPLDETDLAPVDLSNVELHDNAEAVATALVDQKGIQLPPEALADLNDIVPEDLPPEALARLIDHATAVPEADADPFEVLASVLEALEQERSGADGGESGGEQPAEQQAAAGEKDAQDEEGGGGPAEEVESDADSETEAEQETDTGATGTVESDVDGEGGTAAEAADKEPVVTALDTFREQWREHMSPGQVKCGLPPGTFDAVKKGDDVSVMTLAKVGSTIHAFHLSGEVVSVSRENGNVKSVVVRTAQHRLNLPNDRFLDLKTQRVTLTPEGYQP